MTDKQLQILIAAILLAQWGIEDAANVGAQKRAYDLAKVLVARAGARLPPRGLSSLKTTGTRCEPPYRCAKKTIL